MTNTRVDTFYRIIHSKVDLKKEILLYEMLKKNKKTKTKTTTRQHFQAPLPQLLLAEDSATHADAPVVRQNIILRLRLNNMLTITLLTAWHERSWQVRILGKYRFYPSHFAYAGLQQSIEVPNGPIIFLFKYVYWKCLIF